MTKFTKSDMKSVARNRVFTNRWFYIYMGSFIGIFIWAVLLFEFGGAVGRVLGVLGLIIWFASIMYSVWRRGNQSGELAKHLYETLPDEMKDQAN